MQQKRAQLFIPQTNALIDPLESPIIQNQYQQQVVLFKYKRQYLQQTYDQIKIQSKKIKPNPQHSQKSKQKYMKNHILDRQTMINNLFQKLNLCTQTPQTLKAQSKIYNQKEQIKSNKKQTGFFLKKVQILDFNIQAKQMRYLNAERQQICKKSQKLSQNARLNSHNERFNKTRNIPVNEQIKKRIKYKIISLKSQHFVDLNGQRFEYQDLSQEIQRQRKFKQREYNANQSVPQQHYDYYILKKGSLQKQPLCQIVLPQQAQYLLQSPLQQCPMQVQSPVDSQQDSNCQDQQDYDYPEQDYDFDKEDQFSNQSQQVIGNNKRKSSYGGDQDQEYQEDQEQCYRKYLNRCKKMDEGDQQLNYLYHKKDYHLEDQHDD